MRLAALTFAGLLAAASSTSAEFEAQIRALPTACEGAAAKETGFGPLSGLLYSNIEPLCSKYPQPKPGAYLLRLTTTGWPSSRAFVDVDARKGRIVVTRTNTLFTLEGTTRRSIVDPGAFRRALTRAGFDRIWDVSDYCPPDDISITAEIGHIWEFYDGNGYVVRDGPSPQLCATMYKGIDHEVMELVHDLETTAKVVRSWTPEVPKQED